MPVAVGVGIGVGFQTGGSGSGQNPDIPASGDILLEDGVSHIQLESGSGNISQEGTPPAAPAAAVAAGYTTATFYTNNFSARNVDMGLTYAPGYQWYFYNFLGETPTSANVALNSDGTISVGQGGSANNSNLSSIGMIPGAPFFRGIGFGGGFLIRMVVKFNSSSASIATGWPAAWTYSIEASAHGLTDPPLDQWIGQIDGYHHGYEGDLMEYFQTSNSQPITQIATGQHDWYGVIPMSSISTDQNFTPSGGLNNIYHTYDMRVIPATATAGSGSIVFYMDGVATLTTTYSQFNYASGLPVPPPGGTTAYSIVDFIHMAMLFGSNNANPITVQSVVVWQGPGASNMTN